MSHFTDYFARASARAPWEEARLQCRRWRMDQCKANTESINIATLSFLISLVKYNHEMGGAGAWVSVRGNR